MLTLPLPPHIAAGLRDGTITRIVVPCKPNHPGGVIAGASSEPGSVIESYGGGKWSKPSRMEVLKAPFAPGDIVSIQDDSGQEVCRIAILTVEAKWAQEVTIPEIQQAGIPSCIAAGYATHKDAFAADWDSRYAATPVASNPWLWSFGVRLET